MFGMKKNTAPSLHGDTGLSAADEFAAAAPRTRASGASSGGHCRIKVNQNSFKRIQPHMDTIWGNIMLNHGKTPHSILFNSSAPGEGVTLVARSLALHLALEYGSSVLYVNAGGRDAKGPIQAEDDGGSREAMTALLDGGDIATAVLSTNVPGFYVLPFGGDQAKHSQTLLIQRAGVLGDLLAFTKANFDFAIFDSKSVFTAPWTVSLARHMDAVLLVCRYAASRREVMNRAVDTFVAGGAKVDGVILNDRRFPIPRKLYAGMK